MGSIEDVFIKERIAPEVVPLWGKIPHNLNLPRLEHCLQKRGPRTHPEKLKLACF